ncbi:MAG TPA: c-type cytochrome [Casimicrobiaceae bacterium]|nr:c-type cytochrome [Casimicrobiaceae bacterium]
MHDQHSSPIKTWQQLVYVVVLAFVIPIVLILIIAALVTSGQKGENAAPATVAQRIAPVGVVVVDPKAPSTLGTTQPAAAAPAPQTPIVAAVIPPPSAAAPAATVTSGDAKGVYDTACAACHAAGIAGAPKVGDKVAWAPRLVSGKDTLYASSIKGKGAMPPKGGQLQLTDAQVKAAVDFMVAAVR